MKNKKAAKKKSRLTPAQYHLPIAEIKQDTVVLKDGTLRAVLLVSSINFALKNEEEQNAIIAAYVSFLNSLDHPLQIAIQSRRLNIAPYLEMLRTREREQTNELLRAQMADYRSFVGELVELGAIMSKHFYVVVPYDPLSNRKKSFWSRLGELFHPALTVRLKEERFQKRKYELDLRLRQIESGLGAMGLSIVRLDTQSLVELFYSTFNPDIALTETLPPLDKMEVEIS
ncbi:MAG: hypothetical protein HYV42_02170 [Candidatus Magasanikbacteria bacterium]|nr:hypothetical protein [Candidatus Magasanikbacteria bacterium]